LNIAQLEVPTTLNVGNSAVPNALPFSLKVERIRAQIHVEDDVPNFER